jgi:hypothetical protein
MKTAFKSFVAVGAALVCTAPIAVLALQQSSKGRVVSVGTGGVVILRDSKSGRTFKATLPADVASSLVIGDVVELDLPGMRTVSVKGTARAVQLAEPDWGAPCCAVVAFAKDGSALHSMLNALSGSTSVNASQIDLKTLVANGGSVSAIADPAEPLSGVLLVRDNANGAHHLLILSGSTATGAMGATMSNPVVVDERGGFAVLRGANQSFTFPLWKPDNAEQGPWVMTPNPSLSGINGRLVTKFAPGTDSAARVIRVFNPGTENEVSMAVLGEDQTLIEGEYDVKVLRVTVPKVPIKKGFETRLLIGALAFASRDQDLHYVYDAKGEKQLFYLIGYEVIAIPAGKYSLKAGNRVVPFEIKDGQVTTL